MCVCMNIFPQLSPLSLEVAKPWKQWISHVSRTGFQNTVLHQRNQGFSEKHLIVGLEQGEYKMSLEHLVMLERMMRTCRGSQKPAWRAPSGQIWIGLADFISLKFKGLARVFSSNTIGKHQFFVTQLSYGPTLTSVHDYWKDHNFNYRNQDPNYPSGSLTVKVNEV